MCKRGRITDRNLKTLTLSEMGQVELRYKHKRAFVFYIVCAACLILAVIFFAPATKRQLNSWKLLPQPEQLSELYFTDIKQLPSTYVPGRSENVSFTVHNLESRTIVYRYSIVEQSADTRHLQTLASGTFSLAQSQYHTSSIPITLTDLGVRAKVVVQLNSQNETIGYWLKKESL